MSRPRRADSWCATRSSERVAPPTMKPTMRFPCAGGKTFRVQGSETRRCGHMLEWLWFLGRTCAQPCCDGECARATVNWSKGSADALALPAEQALTPGSGVLYETTEQSARCVRTGGHRRAASSVFRFQVSSWRLGGQLHLASGAACADGLSRSAPFERFHAVLLWSMIVTLVGQLS